MYKFPPPLWHLPYPVISFHFLFTLRKVLAKEKHLIGRPCILLISNILFSSICLWMESSVCTYRLESRHN